MGDTKKVLGYATGGILGPSLFGDEPGIPDVAPLPPEVEEASGQKSYTKKKLKSRKGRASTIIASKLGSNRSGGQTLG